MKGHVGYKDGKKGRSWYYKFSVIDAKGKRRTVMKRGFKTKKQAEDAQALAMAGFITGEVVVTPEKTTLLEYSRIWFRDKKLARTTRAGYRNIIESHIANDPVGSVLVSELQLSSIKGYYARRREADLDENTLRRHQAILRPVLDDAILDGLLKVNPARYIKLGKPRKYKAATFDGGQVAVMLEEFQDEEIYPGVLLAVSGALRAR